MSETLNVPDTLARLKALADLDNRVRALDERLDKDPKAVAEEAAKVAAVDAQIKKFEDAIKMARVQARAMEGELKGCEGRIAKLKEQSGSVRTNKEFMAFRAEIANNQAEADRLQAEALKVLGMVEQAEARLKDLRAQRAFAQGRLDEGRAATAARLSDVKAERDRLAGERPARLAGIGPEALDVYDRARRSRGNGVATLEGEFCSACQERQVRNDILAVANGTRVVACKACNRVLVQP
ncbi:MAG: zinc ribbon domain-containing protein [Planctomycetia bacterium]